MNSCKECKYCIQFKGKYELVRSYICKLHNNMILRINYDYRRPQKCMFDKVEYFNQFTMDPTFI